MTNRTGILRKDEALLASYPRERPPLPERHAEIYQREYIQNRAGENVASGLAQKLEAWMHHKVAARPGARILELGAGNLNHLPYESGYEIYDIVEPFKELYENSGALKSVSGVYSFQKDIPPGNRYDRIVSIAVLEHMDDLPREAALSASLLDDEGVFQAGIPSEGEFLWWLGWRSSTGLSYYLRNRLDYGKLMRHEHLNTANEIIRVLRVFFAEVRVAAFPLNVPHLSLYKYVECRSPLRDRAQEYISRKPSE